MIENFTDFENTKDVILLVMFVTPNIMVQLKIFSIIGYKYNNISKKSSNKYIDYFLGQLIYNKNNPNYISKDCIRNIYILENHIKYKCKKNIFKWVYNIINILLSLFNMLIVLMFVSAREEYITIYLFAIELFFIFITIIVLIIGNKVEYNKNYKNFLEFCCYCNKSKFKDMDTSELISYLNIMIEKIEYRINNYSYINDIQSYISIIMTAITFSTSFGILIDIKSADIEIYGSKNSIIFEDILKNNFFSYIFIFIFILSFCYIVYYFIDMLIHTYSTKSKDHNENLIFLKNKFNKILENFKEEEKLLNKLKEINIEIEEINKFEIDKFKNEIEMEKQIKIYNLEIERNKINRQLEILRKEFD